MFRNDPIFLEALNSYRVREYSAALTALDFETEIPLDKLEGKVVTGSVNCSGSSPTRRTVSLTLIFDQDTYNISSVNNIIAVDKKISLALQIQNPFYSTSDYKKYGEVLTIKQGVFIITSAAASISNSGASITVQLVDKMGTLNGTCGGVIPSAAVFHEQLIIDADGNSTTEYPLIRDIIREVVHHFGGESPGRIIIDDVPATGRWVATWSSSTPARFANGSGNFIVTDKPVGTEMTDFPNVKFKGDDVGYLATELTYPGELNCNTGATVTSILDSIVKTLGNYEYFYDVDGYFHFQQIKNFDKTGTAPTFNYTPGPDDDENSRLEGKKQKSRTPFNITYGDDADAVFQSQYIKVYSSDEYLNEFSDSSLVSSVNFNPAYGNLKNDFVVWGKKKDGNVEKAVRYHLAIDDRPKFDPDASLCLQTIWCIRKVSDKSIIKYMIGGTGPGGVEVPPTLEEVLCLNDRGAYSETETYRILDGVCDLVELDSRKFYLKDFGRGNTSVQGAPPIYNGKVATGIWAELSGDEAEAVLHSPRLTHFLANGFDWREELYRRYLLSYGTSTRGSYYDEELAAEWRYIFNPCYPLLDPRHPENTGAAAGSYTNPFWSTFAEPWQDYYGQSWDNIAKKTDEVPWVGYNVDILSHPSKIRYWLDLIDSSSALGAYSVNKIGRRTVAKENTNINEVLNREVPDILFIDGTKDPDMVAIQEKEAKETGQKYATLNSSSMVSYLSTRSSLGSCYEEVRALFYEHLVYKTKVSLTAIPILYLEVNKTVHLNFPEMGIVGNFNIDSIKFDFSNAATMSLSLTESIVIL